VWTYVTLVTVMFCFAPAWNVTYWLAGDVPLNTSQPTISVQVMVRTLWSQAFTIYYFSFNLTDLVIRLLIPRLALFTHHPHFIISLFMQFGKCCPSAPGLGSKVVQAQLSIWMPVLSSGRAHHIDRNSKVRDWVDLIVLSVEWVMIAQRENGCISLSVLSVALATIAQWKK